MQRESGWPRGRIQRPEIKSPFPRKPGSGMWTEIKQEPGATHLDEDFPTQFCPTQVSWFTFHDKGPHSQVSGETVAYAFPSWSAVTFIHGVKALRSPAVKKKKNPWNLV